MNITTVSDTLAINRPRLRPRIGTASDSRMDEWDERERERVRMIKHGGRSKTRSCSKVSRVGRKLAVMYDGRGEKNGSCAWKTPRGRKGGIWSKTKRGTG